MMPRSLMFSLLLTSIIERLVFGQDMSKVRVMAIVSELGL